MTGALRLQALWACHCEERSDVAIRFLNNSSHHGAFEDQHALFYAALSVQHITVCIADILKESDKIINRGDKAEAEALATVVHGDCKARLYCLHKLRCGLCINGKVAAHGDKQDIHAAKSDYLFSGEGMTQIAQMHKTQTLRVNDANGIFTALLTAAVIVEGAHALNLKACGSPGELYCLRAVVVPVKMAGDEKVGCQLRQLDAGNIAGLICVNTMLPS